LIEKFLTIKRYNAKSLFSFKIIEKHGSAGTAGDVKKISGTSGGDVE
jgi:hypothetical protein